MENDPDRSFMRWMSLFRTDPDDHCKPEEVALLACLSPHLVQALEMNRKQHLQRLSPSDGPERRAAIADLKGVVYHADPEFEAMLRLEWPGWRCGALPPALLKHFLAGEARYVGRTLVLSLHVEQRLLFLKVRTRCRADTLSLREYEVAKLAGKGATHKEIAQPSGRSPATVRNQIQSIYDKLQVNNVAGLIEEIRYAD